MSDIRNIFFLFVVFGLFSCEPKTNKIKEKPVVTVDVIIAEAIDLPTNIEVNGSALSEEMIELHPEISGRLTYLNMPDGADIVKGTLLSKINDAELQAELKQLQAQLELAVKTENRLKTLLQMNGVNQSDYDAALNQLTSISANISILEAQIEKTEIRAPFSGTLGLRMVSPGAYVTPQTVLGTLQQTDHIKIDFTVPESYTNLIEVGNEIIIHTNGTTDGIIAVISAIEPQINADTRNMKVRARLKSGNVRPGSFVKVILRLQTKGIVVPTNAIIPDATSNQVVVIKNGKAVFVNVETGMSNANVVELSQGVNQGDSLVVSGILFVRPNSVVKIRKVIQLDGLNSNASKPLIQ
ncbi:MAG: efflux RND transporter periplasmic adaptor subunit [Bacteroidales bacterium]|nr:efflux RND transporter periplasmic adaptor subunit [Bacteroidales bacterium]